MIKSDFVSLILDADHSKGTHPKLARQSQEVIKEKMIIAVIDEAFAAAKKKNPEKIQAITGLEPLTCAIPVQRSTN